MKFCFSVLYVKINYLYVLPQLGDFGLVRQGSHGLHTRTAAQTTTAIGTSAYMAPEAYRGDVSVKMDVFSFGVVT